MSRTRFSGSRGFTLLELLIVATVVAILLMVSVTVFLKAREKARQAGTIADMRSLAVGIQAYFLDHDVVPSVAGDFSEVARILEPYQTTDVPLNDHWEHLYDYRSVTTEYTLISFGKDGIDGPDLTLTTRYDYDRDIVLVNGEFRSWPGDDRENLGGDPGDHPDRHLGHEGDGPPGPNP